MVKRGYRQGLADMYVNHKSLCMPLQGLAISFPVVAMVVLLSSGNAIIAIFAVVSIASIVGSVLGRALVCSLLV